MKNRLASALSIAFLALVPESASAQFQTWIRQFGTTATEQGMASATDSAGGVYVSGWTQGSLGAPFAGTIDAWVARYDNTGNRLWVRQLGTSAEEWVYGAAPDGSGGVFIGGYTDGNIGGPNAGNADVWFAHYDSSGSQLWVRQLGAIGDDTGDALTTDGSGGAYLAGYTDGSLGGPNAGLSDAWLARYDNAGSQLWIRQFGTSGGESASGAAFDGSSGVFVCGATGSNLGGPNAGGSDAWLARYDGAGNQLWARQLGTSGSDSANSVALDGSGGVFVSGGTAGSLGGPSAGGNDVWLAHYDGAGTQLWIKQFGTSANNESSADAASDGLGGVYISGATVGSLGGPNAGGSDAWFAHYDSAGNRIWLSQIGTSGSDGVSAAAPDGTGHLYVCGSTDGNLAGPNAGPQDIWLALYDGPCIPLNYCTAKTNSLGCVPNISSSGLPSFAGTDSFYVTANNVLNNKPGLMIWSLTAASTPFFGGTLCLAAPITRTPGQNSLGSAFPAQDCTGTYSFHFSQAYMLAQLLPQGTQVRAQYWSRDPGSGPPHSASNVGLTNALWFLICP